MGGRGKEQSPAVKAATKAQMQAAQHDVSAWVSANAGAGKTRVLVDRVVRLLLGGTAPGAILCLTYTNAAAAEMSNRLFARLAGWAVMDDAALKREISRLPGLERGVDGPLLRRARNLFAHALETPGGLKIQTIHAFCERLLHGFALEANVPAGFTILDERRGRELLAEATRQVLGAAAREGSENGPAFAHVAALIDEGSLAELIGALAGDRQVRAALGQEDEIDSHLAHLSRLWQVPADPMADDPFTYAAGEAVFDAAAYGEAAMVLGAGSVNDRKYAAIITSALQPGLSAAGRFALLSDLYLTQGGTPRAALITKKPGEAHPHVKEFLEAQQQRFVAAQSLQLLGANRALLQLGLAVVTRFEQMKRRRALLDYDDLILRTRNLLQRARDAQWVLYKLDGGIDHVLIDEAQDTSPEQWQIISALTAEFFAGSGAHEKTRTVFAVGDEKQSIYSFQGADPKEFGRMQAHFSDQAGTESWRDVPLEVSFRSAGAVLKAVDLVFGSEPAARGLSWQEGRIRHVPSREAAGKVEIWPTEQPLDQEEEKPFPAPVDHVPQWSPDIRLADRIAAQIERWLKEGTLLAARGRPIRAGDILILVRRRGNFADAMVRALKRRSLPVAGADRMKLGEQLAVQDLMALGAFILQPDDDLSLACVLKSPLIGCEEDELMQLAARRPGSLWQALVKACTEEAPSPALRCAHERLGRWREAAGGKRPYEFYAGLLDGEALRRDMIARLGSEADDPMNEFLAQALNFEQDHLPDLQGFLAWMAGGETEIKRDMEHGKDEVRVMTVHGAKGLEAGIVFLPDTCRKPMPGKNTRLLHLPGAETGLPVWPVRKNLAPGPLEAAREAAAMAQMEEYHRLLYVAMTRAKDELYICGFETKNGRQKECWYDLARDALAGESDEIAAGTDGRSLLRLRFQTGGETPEPDGDGAAQRAKAAPALPGWLGRAPGAEAASISAPAPSGGAAAGLAPFTGGGRNRFRRGNLVHLLLEYLPELAPAERRQRARRFLARGGRGIDAEQAEALIDEVMDILDKPEFAPWFGPGSRSEAPFAALAPAGEDGEAPAEGPVYGQIDRLSISESEVRILDYKTSRPVPAGLEEVPEINLRQMAAYRRGIRRIFPEKAIYCALLWTDGPQMMELPQALLDKFD